MKARYSLFCAESAFKFKSVNQSIQDMCNSGCLTSAAISHYHTSDSRRSYQIIKFLVSLVNKCPLAKDYLLQAATKWQWAVNWLKSKVCCSALTFEQSILCYALVYTSSKTLDRSYL